MWRLQNNSSSLAEFLDQPSGCAFHCDLSRPDLGVSFQRSDGTECASLYLLPPVTSLASIQVGPDSAPLFPVLQESYFRGADAVAILPQDDTHDFGITTTYRALATDSPALTIEVILSVQTQLLDASPTIDLCGDVPCETPEITPNRPTADRFSVQPSKSPRDDAPAAIYITKETDSRSSICLPPVDQMVSKQMQPPNSGLHIRLLGDFMEKGVIRKTRFWFSYWPGLPTPQELSEHYQALQNEPLPLTP